MARRRKARNVCPWPSAAAMITKLRSRVVDGLIRPLYHRYYMLFINGLSCDMFSNLFYSHGTLASWQFIRARDFVICCSASASGAESLGDAPQQTCVMFHHGMGWLSPGWNHQIMSQQKSKHGVVWKEASPETQMESSTFSAFDRQGLIPPVTKLLNISESKSPGLNGLSPTSNPLLGSVESEGVGWDCCSTFSWMESDSQLKTPCMVVFRGGYDWICVLILYYTSCTVVEYSICADIHELLHPFFP